MSHPNPLLFISAGTVFVRCLSCFAWTIAVAFYLASLSNFSRLHFIHFIWSVMASGWSSLKYFNDSQLLTKQNLKSSLCQTRLPPIVQQDLTPISLTFHFDRSKQSLPVGIPEFTSSLWCFRPLDLIKENWVSLCWKTFRKGAYF